MQDLDRFLWRIKSWLYGYYDIGKYSATSRCRISHNVCSEVLKKELREQDLQNMSEIQQTWSFFWFRTMIYCILKDGAHQ